MTDLFAYQGEAQPTDIRASDPTVLRGGGAAYTLTAEAGAFALGGQAATLTAGHVLPAVVGSFTLTWPPATLLSGYRLAAATGTFVLTGQGAAVVVGYRVPAAVGAFTLAGFPAALIAGHRLEASADSFTLTGEAGTLLHGSALTAEAGIFTMIGASASVVRGYTLTAEAGGVSLSGQLATLQRGALLTADVGAFAATGAAAALRKSGVLAAGESSYLVTGQSVGFNGAKVLSAEAGSVTLTGSDATLTHGLTLTLAAESGSIVMSGHAVVFLVSGTPITVAPVVSRGVRSRTERRLPQHYQLAARSARVVVTGQPVTFRHARRLVASAGSYAAEVGAARLARAARLIVEPLALTSDVVSSRLLVTRTLRAHPLAWQVSGARVTFRHESDPDIFSVVPYTPADDVDRAWVAMQRTHDDEEALLLLGVFDA